MEGHSTGFPHSDIIGLTPAHGSPMLFAVCHVLRRLLTPRHSPFAFSGLTYHAETALSLERFYSNRLGFCCMFSEREHTHTRDLIVVCILRIVYSVIKVPSAYNSPLGC